MDGAPLVSTDIIHHTAFMQPTTFKGSEGVSQIQKSVFTRHVPSSHARRRLYQPFMGANQYSFIYYSALHANCSLARKISMTPVPLMLGWKNLHIPRLMNGDVKKNAQRQRALRIIINFASTLKQEFDLFCCIEASDVSESLEL